ncbi:ClpP/crotonase [Mollisia scopiformis]|uniref:ClpP/crotonase n=1 Tax=Mollisia scopiformis TaxID=149040 RepID=A0A194XL43_MOLSC|nr:ClpP/crotonase [Mollisia scopiformis]KUJ20851.1 ClpP/crotonase [Mollisia scopiformis]
MVSSHLQLRWFPLCLVALSILWRSIEAQQVIAPPPAVHGTLTFNITNDHTIRVTINNPPINLFNNNLLDDMLSFLTSLVPSNRATPPPKVVIFSSSNPDFFMMHRDVQGIIPPLVPWKLQAINNYISITRYLQNITTTVFIAECNGRAFGAGNEVMVQMDMRFAGPNASVGFFEDGLGVFPGGGGQQFLLELVGKARTMEYVLGALQIDGPTGAEIGWFNRYYESADAMTRSIDDLAARISTFPNGTVNATKSGLSWRNPTLEVLEADIAEFIRLDAMPDRAPLEEMFLNVTKNETATPFEMNTPLNMPELYV